MGERKAAIHLYKSHGDYRSAGQTQHEYTHSTACGYVRDNVTNEPEAVTCKHCIAVMRKQRPNI